MNIVKIIIGAVTCTTLTACSGLLTEQKVGDCYSVDTLSATQKMLLNVGSGNPILFAGDQQIVCGCYRDGTLVGAGEGDHLVGTGERDRLAGAGEGDRLAGADEGDRLAGASERDRLAGADEKDHLTGAGERDRLAGADEGDRLAGADERDRLAGADERDRLAGADERDRLAGAGEGDRLAGDFAEFSCRITPECSGFQLVNYGPQQINILTENGRKSVPTKCIVW